MNYQIVIKPAAQRQIKKLTPAVQKSLDALIVRIIKVGHRRDVYEE